MEFLNKVAVVYTSKYGSTAKYAKWIAEDTGADLFKAADCKASDLALYDVIVYGGAVHAGGILGLDFLKKNIRKLEGKRILTFAVGLSFGNEETEKECREINFVKKLKDLPCYFFKGAYNPEEIKGVDSTIMKVVKKMVSGNDPAQKALVDAIDNGADFTDRDSIKELVEEALK